MTRSQESASTPINAGGWKYQHDNDQDRVDFLRHTAAELAVLAREQGYDFAEHPFYGPLATLPTEAPATPWLTEEDRAAYDARLAANPTRYRHELDDADLGETITTAWPEYSPGAKRDDES